MFFYIHPFTSIQYWNVFFINRLFCPVRNLSGTVGTVLELFKIKYGGAKMLKSIWSGAEKLILLAEKLEVC